MTSHHDNCSIAIYNHIQNPNTANVNKDEDKVSCPHHKSKCNWVGNGIHYACVNENNTINVPINVYDTLSGGNQSVLTSK